MSMIYTSVRVAPNTLLYFAADYAQPLGNNYSRITWSLHLLTNESFSRDVEIKNKSTAVWVDDQKYASNQRTFTITKNMDMVLLNGVTNVQHDSKGVKRLEYSFTQAFLSTIGGEYVDRISGSGEYNLPTISGHAYVTGGDYFTDESLGTVRYNVPSDNITNLKVGLYFVNFSNKLVFERNISVIQMGSKETQIALTSEELDRIYAETGNSDSEPIIYYVKSTFNGKEHRSVSQYYRFSIVPSNPEVTVTIEDYNDDSYNVTNDRDVVVAGVNLMKVKIEATAKKGASITSKNAFCNSAPMIPYASDPEWEGYFENVDSGDFKVAVSDSRGNTTTVDISKQLIPYTLPTIDIATRVEPIPGLDSGYFYFTGSGITYFGDFGEESYDNTTTVTYRYKVNDEAYSQWHSINVTRVGENGYTGSYYLGRTPPGQGSGYEPREINLTDRVVIQAVVSDDVHPYIYDRRTYEPDPRAILLEKTVTATPLFDFSKTDFKFNVPVDLPGLSINGVSLDDYIRQIVESM